MEDEYSLTKYFQFQQPHIRAKIIGVPLIILGIISLLYATSLSIKIGFTSILIGLFMIFLITEKSIPKKISDAQIEGNMDVIRRNHPRTEPHGKCDVSPEISTAHPRANLHPLTQHKQYNTRGRRYLRVLHRNRWKKPRHRSPPFRTHTPPRNRTRGRFHPHRFRKHRRKTAKLCRLQSAQINHPKKKR